MDLLLNLGDYILVILNIRDGDHSAPLRYRLEGSTTRTAERVIHRVLSRLNSLVLYSIARSARIFATKVRLVGTAANFILYGVKKYMYVPPVVGLLLEAGKNIVYMGFMGWNLAYGHPYGALIGAVSGLVVTVIGYLPQDTIGFLFSIVD